MVRIFNAVGAAGKAEGQVYSMKFIVDKKNEKDSCHVHELNERIMATATYRDDGDGHGRDGFIMPLFYIDSPNGSFRRQSILDKAGGFGNLAVFAKTLSSVLKLRLTRKNIQSIWRSLCIDRLDGI